jgi:hypothetical protein
MKYTLISCRSRSDVAARLSYAAKIIKDKKDLEPLVIFDKKISNECMDLYKLFKIKKINSYLNFLSFYRNIILIIKSFFYFLVFFIKINFKGLDWFVDNFKVNQILVGDLIYDRYIRTGFEYLNPNIYNLKFLKLLFFATLKINIICKIFKNYNVCYCLIGSKSYLSMSALILRVSKKFGIKTLFIGGGIFSVYSDNYNEEPSKYCIQKVLKETNKKKLIKDANKYFKNRINGRFSSDTNQAIRSWDEKYWSKFSKNKIFLNRLIIEKKKYKKLIVFASHSFSENNHYTGSVIFRDYFQQFVQTIEFAKKDKNNLWLFKLHPASKKKYNELDTSLDVLKKYLSQNILICPLRFSHKLLFKHADLIISSRGTINIEAACYGVPNLITTGAYYDGFGFSNRVRTKRQYFDYLSKKTKYKHLNERLKKKAKEVLYIKKNLTGINKYNIASRRICSKKIYFKKIENFIKKGNKKMTFNYNEMINNLVTE